MFGSGHVRQWCKGIFPSNASRWCYRAAARSAPIRPESTKRWLRLAFIPIGLLASRSVPSTARSLPEIHRKREPEMEHSLMEYWLAEAEEWKQLRQSIPSKDEFRIAQVT